MFFCSDAVSSSCSIMTHVGESSWREAPSHALLLTTLITLECIIHPFGRYPPQVAGDPTVSTQLSKFMGVRNGIDVDIWDPATDASLPQRFGVDDMIEGKAACREALRQRLGLTGWGDKPLVGVVSRLTAQKGAPLILLDSQSLAASLRLEV